LWILVGVEFAAIYATQIGVEFAAPQSQAWTLRPVQKEGLQNARCGPFRPVANIPNRPAHAPCSYASGTPYEAVEQMLLHVIAAENVSSRTWLKQQTALIVRRGARQTLPALAARLVDFLPL
jgi:hypothetical protein